jgi:hypothetical protein
MMLTMMTKASMKARIKCVEEVEVLGLPCLIHQDLTPLEVAEVYLWKTSKRMKTRT